MPRPRKCRKVSQPPAVSYFKPRGIPMRELTEVYLTVEGCEALRLSDLEGLNQAEAAERMGVSRHTFGRVLAEARKAVSEAVVCGRGLRIEGGDYNLGRSQSGPPACPRGDQPAMEVSMSKIAVSCEGDSLQDLVDGRFGRAAGFLVVDTESGATEYVPNGAAQTMAQGAGIKAAETVAKAGAGVVLTGYVGPKAFKALSAAGIKVGQELDGLTVAEAVRRYGEGQVAAADGPNRGAGGR